MNPHPYVKERSIVALAIILGSAAPISQPIEVRATEGSFQDNRGMSFEQPDRWKSSASIGAAMLASKRYDVAIRFLTAALDEGAKNEDAAYLHKLRGDAYTGKGDSDRATADYALAVNFVPTNSAGFRMRGRAYEMLGNYKSAAADYTKGVALSPDDDAVINSLAWLRATCPEASVRDGQEAMKAGTRACELTRWKNSSRIDTLAAAYAEMGSFSQAVKFEQQALALRSVSPTRRDEMQNRLVSYQHRKPYRETARLRARH